MFCNSQNCTHVISKRLHMHTEDGLPVYSVYVENAECVADGLKEYCGQFGEVVDVEKLQLITLNKIIKDIHIIKFSCVNGATAAILEPRHTIDHFNFIIRPCPSWKQPTPNILPNGIDPKAIRDMLSYFILADFTEQIQLSRVDEQMAKTLRSLIDSKLNGRLTFKFLNTLNNWDMYQFFKIASPDMKCLECSPYCIPLLQCPELYQFIAEFCTKITSLCFLLISDASIQENIFQTVNCNNITELELYNCCISDSEMGYFELLPNLRKLGLGLNGQITGDILSWFNKLEYLSVFGCVKLNEYKLYCGLENINLRYLDIRYVKLKYLAPKHTALLETLKLNGSFLTEELQLPCLKNLEIVDYQLISYANFLKKYGAQLLELKLMCWTPLASLNCDIFQTCKNLKTLWLSGNKEMYLKLLKYVPQLKKLEELNLVEIVNEITDEQILPIIKSCKKLKRLGLRQSPHITYDLIEKTISILSNRRPLPTSPLLILIAGTGIPLNERNYLLNRHLVQLSATVVSPVQGLINQSDEFDTEKKQMVLWRQHGFLTNIVDENDLCDILWSGNPINESVLLKS